MGVHASKGVRTGLGFDLHRLKQGQPFRLGGIDVQSDRGPVGHSDGDVLLHAVTDALLGAVGDGDIGDHFPDDAEENAGADSARFLTEIWNIWKDRYVIENIDATIFLETPKLGALKKAMRDRIAILLESDVSRVNVKAKTMEQLGAIGASAAVAAQVAVLVSVRPDRGMDG